MEFLGLAFIWIGVFFCALGVGGMIRFPDVYMRLHAAGEISTIGLAGILLGAAILLPSATLKLIALAGFLVVTAPVATHAIAVAAHHRNIKPVRDLRTHTEIHDEALQHAPEDVPTPLDTGV